MNKTEELKSEY